MASDQALTYEGALRLLGKHDHKWIKRIDLLLGGVVLGAGIGALLSNPATAPVVFFTALWGWVDQKNEAVRLVSQALAGLPSRRKNIPFPERVEQMTAAHTVLVVSAYFEALREALGDDYDLLKLSEVDKANIAQVSISQLYMSNVPTPSVHHGFSENIEDVNKWQRLLHREVVRSFGHLLTTTNKSSFTHSSQIPENASRRYESHYVALMAEIPEFQAWAVVTEHAATRSEVRALRDDLLYGNDSALSRLERALSTFVDPGERRLADQPDRVARANRSVLDDPILRKSTGARYGKHLMFPSVKQAFLTPDYRFAVVDDASRPADDTWWSEQPLHNDLHIRLMAHLASTESTSRPLLLLGHPGAGKSMLSKVLASRLPASGYTVVRVPLRRTDGHSSVLAQIQQALDYITGERVIWTQLVDQSVDTVKVVILDGLDELLQQTHTRLYGYLEAVADFQRREADQGHPVSVIVTSRTLACDRVDIAPGTTMIKLEDFTDDRIQSWLTSWHRANAAGIVAGTVRQFPPEVALSQRKLIAQPLLLLMMAIYVSNPEVTTIDERISSAELYRRLLEHFAEREAEKSSGTLPPQEMRRRVDKHLARLSTASLGMFNRGTQDITARQLEDDLKALTGGRKAIDINERALGEFFFVYASESRVSGERDQRYEFLHSTFGDYLVASRVIDELHEVTRAAFSSHRGEMRTPNDDLFFALLSHQPLAQLRPALTFVTQLGRQLSQIEVEQMLEVLDLLIDRHRVRPQSERYRAYLSDDDDQIARLAAYSANLVFLRLALSPNQQNSIIRIVVGPNNDPFGPWRSLLALWQAGLSVSAWHATISFLDRIGDCVKLGAYPSYGLDPSTQQARLSNDRNLELIHRFGEAFVNSSFWAGPHDNWSDVIRPWLAHGAANGRNDGLNVLLIKDTSSVEPKELESALIHIEMLLKLRVAATTIDQAKSLVEFLLSHNDVHKPCGFALAATVIAHPDILEEIPSLTDPKWFLEDGVNLILRLFLPVAGTRNKNIDALLDSVTQYRGVVVDEPINLREVEQLWRAHIWPIEAIVNSYLTEVGGFVEGIPEINDNLG